MSLTKFPSSLSKDTLKVNTIDDLRNITDPKENSTAQVLGYYTPGDGGGGPLRVWKTGGSYVDNGIDIIVPIGGDGSSAWVWANYDNITLESCGVLAGGNATTNTTNINSAYERFSFLDGAEIKTQGSIFEFSGTIEPRRGVVVNGIQGKTRFKLSSGANTELVKSYKFDALYAANAYQISDDPDMTLDYGFAGIVFDGNKANQSGIHNCISMYGRRLTFEKCIITESSGVSWRTALKGSPSGTYDDTKSKTPGNIDEVEIINSFEEAWVFEGPSDQAIGHVVTNVVGDQSNPGTTPQTSTLYPGEPVHAVRVMDAMTVDSMNLNGSRFGRNLYVNARLTADRIITAGGWGNVWITSNSLGTIGQLITQANPYNWDSTVYPSLLNESDDLIFSSVTSLRVSGQDQSTAPLIKDSGGSQWGTIRNRQAIVELGTFFVADASGIHISNMFAGAADVALNTTSNCNRIDLNMEFNNCNTVWDNDSPDIRGSWDLTGTINAGQSFSTGLDSSPNADEESLSNARIEFLDNGVWKSNSFRGSVAWDSTSANGQSIVATHGMWRAPKAEEIQLTARSSGWATEPNGMSLTINGFNATTVTARVKLETPSTGTPTDAIIFRVN